MRSRSFASTAGSYVEYSSTRGITPKSRGVSVVARPSSSGSASRFSAPLSSISSTTGRTGQLRQPATASPSATNATRRNAGREAANPVLLSLLFFAFHAGNGRELGRRFDHGHFLIVDDALVRIGFGARRR